VVRIGHESIRLLLLERGGRVGGIAGLSKPEVGGAVIRGHTAIVELLLESGVHQSEEILAQAARCGNYDNFKRLLKQGVPVTSGENCSPLFWSCS
jgi:hypothetical protein